MRTSVKLILPTLAIATLAVAGVITSGDSVFADTASSIQSGVNSVGGDDNSMTLQEGIKNIVNMILFLLGSIAVIMIIIGGVRYVTSNGDSGATKSAKDTILYAVIGLIVAIMAYAIVNFVIGAFASNGGGGGGTGGR